MAIAIATAPQPTAANTSGRTAGSDSGRINPCAARSGGASSTRTAATPSRQPIFLPAARERGVNVTGRSTIGGRPAAAAR